MSLKLNDGYDGARRQQALAADARTPGTAGGSNFVEYEEGQRVMAVGRVVEEAGEKAPRNQ